MRQPSLAARAVRVIFAAGCLWALLAAGVPAAAVAQGWRLTSPAYPEGPNGMLSGVSCWSSTGCMAVGRYLDREVQFAAVAESWNGSSWSVMPMAAPAALRRISLGGVSCWSVSGCVAVGTGYTSSNTQAPFAERWNGARWLFSTVPLPAGAGAGELLGLSCTGASACTAVGETHGGGTEQTLVDRWNGSAWSAQPTPNPANGAPAGLDAVSCAGTTACVAVGSYHVSYHHQLIAETWNGSTWTLTTLPQPKYVQGGPAVAGAYGISCPAVDACVAAGDFQNQPLIEKWDGAQWSAQELTLPSNYYGPMPLKAISCASAAACAAVGQYGGTGAVTYTLVAGTWQAQTFGSLSLSGVACWSAGDCQAVGTSSSNFTGAALSSGSTFGSETIPNPEGVAHSTLAAISCPTSSACTAVGTSGAPPGKPSPVFAERWDGRTWAIQHMPSVATDEAYPDAISCPTTSSCVAVGLDNSLQGNASTTALWTWVWDGSAWSSHGIVKLPAGYGAIFRSVSCATANSCEAAGADLVDSSFHPLLYHWNGSAWTRQPAPLPPGESSGELTSISCPAASFCLAVGSAKDSSGVTEWYDERYGGSTWTTDVMPQDNSRDELWSVSCATTSRCTAVGGTDEAVAETWNGTGWTISNPINPDNGSGLLYSVSCPSTTACLAVGENQGVNTQQALAESWNGTNWATQDVIIPPNGAVYDLPGASCSSATACVVVGGVAANVGVDLPLIETFSG